MSFLGRWGFGARPDRVETLGVDPLPGRAVSAAPREEVGGKAWQLGQLQAYDLPVPPFVVVPARAFREALWQAGLMPLAEQVEVDPPKAPALVEGLRTMRLPRGPAWVAAVEALAAAPSTFAVRSSGIEEDGAVRSFAGIHHTALGVAPADVPEAVRACWMSLYSEAAVAYRMVSARHGPQGPAGPPPGAMAVILQQLIEPRCAGVLFTMNPATGSFQEMVVEAVWGLGEGLVSGQIAPHYYVVRRPRSLPGPLARVAARVRLSVMSEDLPDLTEQFVATAEGVVRQPTPARRIHKRTLEPAALKRLCRLGLRAERAFGGPLDIEWLADRDGTFRLLQARPITATGTPRDDTVLWTRRFMGERWPEPATTLGWSLLAPVIEWLIAYPELQARRLGGGPALKLVDGYPYVNATVFRHLAFKLPGAPPPAFMLELVPPDEERAWRRRFAVAPDLAVYAAIFRTTFAERRWERFRWNPFTNAAVWARFEGQLSDALPMLAAPVTSPRDAVDRVVAHERWLQEYVSIHICSLLFANLFWQILDGALSAWLPEQHASLMERLATSPPGNLTVQTNQALHVLASVATDEDLDALSSGASVSSAFQEALDAFLVRFGHRSESSWELMSPRWRHDPARLVPLLRAQEGSEAPEVRAAALEQRYHGARATLETALSGPRLALALSLVDHARAYLLLRENQRFWFDRLLYSMQETLNWLGRWAAEAGVLASPQDVAQLTWDELQAVAAGSVPDGLSSRIEERRAERIRNLTADPPTFLRGDTPTPEPADAARLDGLGISPGRVRGRVRVLRSVSEGAALAPGEILVARAVDPGWTPLFGTAGGVILELGSLLSHGAVVAREYGLPAVVNIERATLRLTSGQEVTVDGTRGVVWVH